ncbi:MAG: serine--tRNA ligase [Candidatus Andersenbacteria bacterium]|nr:serine--tRNA ligase [Candidatus Andersenbacteria bacterium]MBI3250346.1 serine--tRNA ligase [Candidatus Andersenbacteria bacterium]
MIDIEAIRSTTEAVAKNLARRGVPKEQVEALAALDTKWRRLTESTDALRSQQNVANKEISAASGEERQKLITTMKTAAQELKQTENELQQVAADRLSAWRQLPNLVADDVPEGGEQDFAVVTEVGSPAQDKQRKHYLDLVPSLVDLDRAAKVSGSRFVYLKGQLARLEFALVSYAMDVLSEKGFTPVVPPVLLKEEAMAGMGYLDHDGDEIYRTQDDLYLAGTSEQPIGAMHSDEILDLAALPARYVGFSTCFRREAGSHGKDVRGMLRVHQFDKVEMFSLTTPDKSTEEHEFILEMQRALLNSLQLPYRVINIATGDLGAPATKKYDIETWLPGEGVYRETNSASNTTDYQSRRLNIRYRTGEGKKQYVHMLNGTAFAIGRILIALTENHQQADGSIVIPEALHPYLPFTSIAAPE